MLNFTTEELEKFRKLQNSKDNPWDIEKKLIEKTIKYVNYIKWAPWLKMIAIWNSVAMNSANDESDIDLFIVAAPNRIWIVRILITLIFQVLWVRKTDKHHKGRFCLSFFCTTNALNFESIAIENDIYLYNRILSLKPILNYDNTYQKFIEENSKWMKINYEFKEWQLIKIQNKSSSINEWQSLILNFLEKLLKSIFFSKTKKTFEKLWKPFWVIINEDILKFHNDDKRIKIRNKIFN